MKPKISEKETLKSSANWIEDVYVEMRPQENTVLWSGKTPPSTEKPRFAVCVDNHGQEVSLEKGKIYQVLPDQKAAAHGSLRIIDESGEDYLFPAQRFVPIELPQAAQEALLAPKAQHL